MEVQLLSVILGISIVLLIALVIGCVYAIVRVVKLTNELQGLNIYVAHEFENHKKDSDLVIFNTNQQIQEVYRTLDSRLDKQYDKILKEVSPNKKFLQLISRTPGSDRDNSVDDDSVKGINATNIKRIMDKLDNLDKPVIKE